MAKSSGETWTLIFTVYGVSLIITILFLFYYVDRKIISYTILGMCLIYFSLFVFLNIIVMFDITFSNKKAYKLLFNIITNFYLIFSLVSKILGLLIFPILINYFESGYFTLWKKFIDLFVRLYYKIMKYKKLVIIIVAVAAVAIITTLLTLFIIYKDDLGLQSPIQYICILLDLKALVEIYVSVGFFIVQSIIDYKRQKDVQLILRYYRYSIIKVITETEKLIIKIKTTHKEINKVVQTFEKNNLPPYYNYLQEFFKDVEENMKLFELYGIKYDINNNDNNNNKDNNNNNNNNINNNNENINNGTITVYNINNDTENTKNNQINKIKINNNYITNTDHNIPSEEIKNLRMDTKSNDKNKEEKLNNKSEDKKEKSEKEETMDDKEEELQKYIRKYKKSVRKINKMKKIYKDFEHEKQYDSNHLKSKYFYIKYIILFLAFAMVVITDLLVPLICYTNEDDKSSTQQNTESDEDEDPENPLSVFIGFILIIPVYFLCSTYTIIVVFSTIRRRYISGDYLSGKQTNDNLNLIKTVKLICGYSFSVIYCNLYFWKAMDREGDFGNAQFYDKIIIPDYNFESGVSIIMIIKIVLIVVSAILFLKFGSIVKYFRNDLAEYNIDFISNKNIDLNKELEDFNRFIKEKSNINNFLNN